MWRSKHVDRREAIEEKNRDVRLRKSEITQHVVLRASIACFVTRWKVGVFKESAVRAKEDELHTNTHTHRNTQRDIVAERGSENF